MLRNIRSQTQSGGTYILVGILIVVFAVFFGVPGDSCGKGTSRHAVAKVAGTTLFPEDIGIIANRSSSRDDSDADRIEARAGAIRAISLIYLLAEHARAMGMRTDDIEFQDYIKSPMLNFEFRYIYGQEGAFDGPLYKRYVQYQLGVPVAKYEEFKRRELLARKYITSLVMHLQASTSEVEALRDLRENRVNVEYTKFYPDRIKNFVPVSDDEVAAYLATSAKKVEERYDKVKEQRFTEPEEVLIRRIFIPKADLNDGTDNTQTAAEKFEEAKRRVIEEKEDFGEVAAKMSEDFAKDKKGLLDWSQLQNFDQDVARAIKDSKIGDVKVVDTAFAMMLVKLEDRKEAKAQPLEAVRDDLARELVQEKLVDARISELVVEFRKATESAESMADALKSLRGESDENEESEKDKKDADEPNIWAAIVTGESGFFALEGEATQSPFSADVSGVRERGDWDVIPRIGKSAKLTKDAFALTKENPLSATDYDVSGAKTLIRLIERKAPDEEFKPKDRMKFATEIRGRRVRDIFGPWQSLFSIPKNTTGRYLDAMFDAAVKDGKITFLNPKDPAVAIITKSEDEEEAPIPIQLTDPTKSPAAPAVRPKSKSDEKPPTPAKPKSEAPAKPESEAPAKPESEAPAKPE